MFERVKSTTNISNNKEERKRNILLSPLFLYFFDVARPKREEEGDRQ